MAGAPARSLHVLGVEVPPEAHSLAGFRAWVASLPDAGPRLRATFCGGGVYVEDRPQDDDSHAPLVAEVNRVLGNLTVAGELGMYFAPPSSFTHAKAGVSTEPDGMLVRFETFRAGRARVNPDQRTELVGTPDLVLEVVSRSSARKDLVDLVRDYARARAWPSTGSPTRALLLLLLPSTSGCSCSTDVATSRSPPGAAAGCAPPRSGGGSASGGS